MSKVDKVMHEYGEGKLHSGSKHGPVVHNQKQAVAIALSEARKAGEDIPAQAKRTVHHSPTMLEVDHHKMKTVTSTPICGCGDDYNS